MEVGGNLFHNSVEYHPEAKAHMLIILYNEEL